MTNYQSPSGQLENEPVESNFTGLTVGEVEERRRAGQVNDLNLDQGQTYWQIFLKDLFTFSNVILIAVSIILVVVGDYTDLYLTVGLFTFNAVTIFLQEAVAMRDLRQMSLQMRSPVQVIRAGSAHSIQPTEVVLGDILCAYPGDRIAADGVVVVESMQVDESPLTGVGEPSTKHPGDTVYAGSVCLHGSAYYQVEKVGKDLKLNSLIASRRAFSLQRRHLQHDVNYVVRVIIIISIQMDILIAISMLIQRVPLIENARIASVIVALVPKGLLFMDTVTYTLASIRLRGHNSLLISANAAESISNVDVLCLDKTGTITCNELKFHAYHLLQRDWTHNEIERLLGTFAASISLPDPNITALNEAFHAKKLSPLDELPFSAGRDWCAISWNDDQRTGTYYLGTAKALKPIDETVPSLQKQLNDWSCLGYRVLLLAYSREVQPLYDQECQSVIYGEPEVLAMLAFEEELRPDVKHALMHFSLQGVELKILTGDTTQSAVAVARQLGWEEGYKTLLGKEIDQMSDAKISEIIDQVAIFSQVAAHQKERIVKILQQKGHYVGMIGDGANDVLALRQASLSVAMCTGSEATRSTADIVLLDDSYTVLPLAVREGWRIRSGMRDVISLILIRKFYVLLVVVAVRMVGVTFPDNPRHSMLLALFTVGIPILALAFWAKPQKPPDSLLRSIGMFVFPVGVTLPLGALLIYLLFLKSTGSVIVARSAINMFIMLCGLTLIPFIEPPSRLFTAVYKLNGDWRPTILAIFLLAAYVIVLAVEPLRNFIGLQILSVQNYLIIIGAFVFWVGLQYWLWRVRLFERAAAIGSTA
jgi:cation-transporting ATPase E